MAVTISSGKTWTTGESCTASKLNTMFSGAGISGLDQTHVAANYGMFNLSSSSPSDTDSLWGDTNTSNAPFYYNGSAWVPVGFTSDFIEGCIVSTPTGGGTIDVSAGTAYINGELRTNAAEVSTNPGTDPGTGDYLDVWILADVAASEAFTVSFVDAGTTPRSSSNPGTNGRLIGSVYHNGSGVYSKWINYRPDCIFGWSFIQGDNTTRVEETLTFGGTTDNSMPPRS